MKLYQALKAKKKLAAEISQLWKRLQETNSVVKGSERNYDPKETMIAVLNKTKELVALKNAIQVANKPIQDKIFWLSELKSQVAHLRYIPTKRGTDILNSYAGQITQEYEAAYSNKEIDEMITATESAIAKMQDELEQYNFVTEIHI